MGSIGTGTLLLFHSARYTFSCYMKGLKEFLSYTYSLEIKKRRKLWKKQMSFAIIGLPQMIPVLGLCNLFSFSFRDIFELSRKRKITISFQISEHNKQMSMFKHM